MYPPFSSDVTHQEYSGLEERKVKLARRERGKCEVVLKSI